MIDWLRSRARESPRKTALIAPGRETNLSYRHLDRRVDRVCHRLEELGLRPGNRLGVLAEDSLPTLQLVLSGLRTGIVVVPLHADHTAGEVSCSLRRVSLSALVGEGPILRDLNEGLPPGDVHEIGSLPLRFSADEPVDIPPYPGPGPAFPTHDPALMLFTSGTTGQPRAVPLTQRNIHHHVRASARRLGRGADDVWLSPLPTYHMGGIAPLLRSVYNGSALRVSSNNRGDLARAIREHEVSCVSLVPPMLRDLLDGHADLPWSTLRFVLLGGGPISRELIRRCRSDSVPVRPTYGMTETCSQITTARPGEAHRHPDSSGRPLQGLTVRVVGDDETVRDPGQTGEIVVSGPSVFHGYVSEPETNADVFSHRGFHTGDYGRLDPDGRLTVLNRREDRIVSGGKNIDPAEVRRALLEHPSLSDAAVVGLPHERWGQTPGALVRVEPDAGTGPGQIESFLRQRLSDYKIPRRIETTDRIPRTVSGTVDRTAVRERLGDPGEKSPDTAGD